jgi:hypothetical protein
VGATLLTGLERRILLIVRVGIEVTLFSFDNNSMRKSPQREEIEPIAVVYEPMGLGYKSDDIKSSSPTRRRTRSTGFSIVCDLLGNRHGKDSG